jgi:hypothetical protein
MRPLVSLYLNRAEGPQITPKLAQSKTAAWLANNNPIGFKETAQNHFMKSTFRLYWCLFG